MKNQAADIPRSLVEVKAYPLTTKFLADNVELQAVILEALIRIVTEYYLLTDPVYFTYDLTVATKVTSGLIAKLYQRTGKVSIRHEPPQIQCPKLPISKVIAKHIKKKSSILTSHR